MAHLFNISDASEIERDEPRCRSSAAVGGDVRREGGADVPHALPGAANKQLKQETTIKQHINTLTNNNYNDNNDIHDNNHNHNNNNNDNTTNNKDNDDNDDNNDNNKDDTNINHHHHNHNHNNDNYK